MTPKGPSPFPNPLSLLGLGICALSLPPGLFLLLADFFSTKTRPYVGILTYLVIPAFIAFGLGLALAGAGWEGGRRERGLARGAPPPGGRAGRAGAPRRPGGGGRGGRPLGGRGGGGLPGLRVHRFGGLLRRGLPQGDAAGVRGLPALAPRPGDVRRVPRGARRRVVREG